MDSQTLMLAALLGLVEGLTEFIPVSSTGHLLLAGHFLGFESKGKVFEVAIQLGAVLAILSVYAIKLLQVARSLPVDPAARRFVGSVALAFLPAAAVGVLAHDYIKNVLFETPALVAWMLILGGVVLVVVDRRTTAPTHTEAMRFPLGLSFAVGLCQCLAMIPGVSRSGATIVGALLLGADRRSAAEFSFFLSMPTMAGAFAYDLYKNRDLLSWDDLSVISLGFAMAFVSAVVVVRGLLGFVSSRGFAVFGWWRIGVGAAALAGLALS